MNHSIKKIRLIYSILSPKVQSFIEEHKLDNPDKLLLKYKSILGAPASIVVDQIVGRRKAKEKLPSWYENAQIIYPPSINVEQASSERAAQHKVKILENDFRNIKLSESVVLDLTGGFGVDSFYLCQVFREVHFVEPNENLLEITRHNHRQLGAVNIHYYNTSAEEFLNKSKIHFDFIYIDPSRRSKGSRKIFFLNQCDPDIGLLQDKIWKIAKNLLIKTSPLLDIYQGIKELKYVKKVVVLSIEGECKELLFFCQKNFGSEALIEATNIGDTNYSLSFQPSGERKEEIRYADPMKYLYEPNASILKGGAFKTIASIFNVYKLHPNTHLYTSSLLIENFPGRIFQVESLVKAHAKTLREFFPEGYANITTRNYFLSVDELKKKTGLKDGGDKFLLGFSGVKKKFLVVAGQLPSNGL